MTIEITPIGFVGCGVMGKGMIKNLIKQGYPVYAHDVNETALNEVSEFGATPCSNVQDLAANSSVLITSLPNPDILRTVIKEAVNCLPNLSFIVDVSTTDLETTKELANLAHNESHYFFDCPLSGGPEGAEKGELTVMVGGPPSLFPRIEPVLEAIGNSINYIGEVGSGQIVKLCNNYVVAGTLALLSEAFIIGEQAGVSKDKIAKIMENGSASSKALSVFGPNLLQESFDHILFQLSHMEKDLRFYQNLLPSTNELFVSKGVHNIYESAKEAGKGGLDTTAIKQFLEEQLQYESSP